MVDPRGDVYIGDTHNHAVRRIRAATGQISTIAAAGSRSPAVEGVSGGDAADGSLFTRICGLDIDEHGRLFVPDWVADDADELLVLRPCP